MCSDHGSGGSEESEDSDDAASREDDLFFDDSYLHEEEPKNPHELHKHGSISEPLSKRHRNTHVFVCFSSDLCCSV